MKNRIFRYIIAAIIITGTFAGTVMGGSLTYNNQRKTIKAGVISFSPGILPQNPYIFYVMDQRLDIKPAGWDFVNPNALSSHKEQAAYWEVSLNTAFEDIGKFDVLYLAAPNGTTYGFSNLDKQKLRKFVDAGGTLWIENGGNTYGTIDFTNFFISNIDFDNTGSRPSKGTNDAHPLLARPFQLSWQDINRLGDNGVNGSVVTGSGANDLPDEKYFANIIEASNGDPIISGAQYGSGHIVLVGEPLLRAIAQTVGESSPGIANASRLLAAHPEDLKMAYNIVNWGSEYTTFHKDPRHTGYSFAEVGAPLSILWEYTAAAASPNFTAPVILNDSVFYVDGDILRAFDISTSRDRDKNGSSDDGIADQANGAPYDELWNSNVGQGASLTAAYVPFNGNAIPGIAAVGLNGDVYGFDANSTTNNASSIPLFNTNSLPNFSSLSAPSLTYSDGGLFIGDENGSLHGISDFDILGGDWVAPKVSITQMGPTSGSPTVGYVYDRISGAVEQLVYMPRQAGASAPGGVQVYPIRVFNDMLTAESSGTGWVPLISRRSIGCTIKAGAWRVYVPDGNNEIDITANARLTAQPGTFEVDMDYLLAQDLLGKPILADYDTDPKGLSFMPRSTINIKTSTNSPADRQGVSGTPALGKDDILYFGTGNGSLYATQESTSPDPRRGASLRTEVRWRSALTDNQLTSLIGGSFNNPAAIVGSPSVGNDMAYFVVQDPSSGDSYIMAYKSSPQPEINLGVPIQFGTSVEFVQEDSMNPGTEAVRISYNPAQRNRSDWVDVNYATGKIVFRNLRTGAPQRDFSTTQDITVSFVRPTIAGGDGQSRENQVHYAFPQMNGSGSYTRTNPDDRWNNLVWMVKLPQEATSSPMLYGSKLYVGMEDGMLACVDVNKMKDAASSIDLNADNTAELTYEGNLGVLLKWNEDKGFMWRMKVTNGPASPIYATVAGSNGIMAVATANGLSILYNSVTLVADGNRVAEVDSGGNIVWSCDSTVSTVETTTGNANDFRYNANAVPFNRPAVARRSDIGGIVVADTGNNRIVLMDTAGNSLWDVKDFIDPDGIISVGMPLTLSKPQDVTAWMQWNTATDMPEYHFLIADTGNFRIIDIVAKWDNASQSFKNVLGWISRSALEGKAYAYTSARAMPEPANWNNWVIMAIVSNQQAMAAGAESPGGALVKMTYDPANSPLGEMIGDPYMQLPVDVAPSGNAYGLFNPRFFNRVYKNSTNYTEVVIDAEGIHCAEYTASGYAIRHYTNADYFTDRGRPLSASYVQILPNGNLLVTNKALSNDNAGEVFELTWDDLNNRYIITWPTDLNMRFGANSFGFRQPSSAERQVF